MDYIAKAIPVIMKRDNYMDVVFRQDEIDEMHVQFDERMKSGEGTICDPDTIAGRVVAIALMMRKIDPSTIEGKPHEANLIKEEFEYGFMGRHEECGKCGSEMMGRIHAYPPYCDSTYEEWSCPVCGKGGWGSSI
jgi:hypothetical protein